MSDLGKGPNDLDDDLELDFLGEVSRLGMEKAGDLLSQFLGKSVKMGPPKVMVISASERGSNFGIGDFERVGTQLKFNGTYNGSAHLMFQKDVADSIVSKMTGEKRDSQNWKDMVHDVLSEMGNIVLNGVVGTMSNIVKGKLIFQVPTLKNGYIEEIIENNFDPKTEVSFVGLGLFHLEDIDVDGVISFSFNFENVSELLSSIKSMKDS
jgi:chemotaxis protein CheC